MYKSAIRNDVLKRIEELGKCDIIMGIPCFNNEKTIDYVVETVSEGLYRYYRDYRCVIFVSDGGSTDDTREVAMKAKIRPWQEKIVGIYRGIGGKGSALRAIFEAVSLLKAKACAVVDSDLRSITPDWVKKLVDPVIEKGYHFVAPVYIRHKYDGTITNNIVYNMTRALYGKRIRQPIGGDFGFSSELASVYLSKPVWDTDVARFGIDIWMTTEAIVHDFKICQANLGIKVHDAKDPAAHLGPMFRQVVWTLFTLMEENESYWKKVSGSEPVETFWDAEYTEPVPVTIDLKRLVYEYKTGFNQFAPLWESIFTKETFKEIKKTAELNENEFSLPADLWAHILYELAAEFHSWDINRYRLISTMVPLYFGRVASFAKEVRELSSLEAEKVVEKQAEIFEKEKPYLLSLWNGKMESKADKSKDKQKTTK